MKKAGQAKRTQNLARWIAAYVTIYKSGVELSKLAKMEDNSLSCCGKGHNHKHMPIDMIDQEVLNCYIIIQVCLCSHNYMVL